VIEESALTRVPVADGVALRVIARDASPGTQPQAPVLLVHGLASNARMWDGVGEELARLGHPSVAVDQRGHGRSVTSDDSFDFPTLAADLVAVIDATGLARCIVAGQSWGANVVLELAARHPERTSGVVCVDGGMGSMVDAIPDWEDARERLAPPRLVGTPLVRIEGWFRGHHPDWPATGIAGALANFRMREDGTVEPWLSRERHLAILRHLWEHRPADVYPRLTVPVLLLVAEWPGMDAGVAVHRQAALDAIVASGADVRLTRFSPGDHDLHAQFPERIAAAIAALAAEIPR
jgi:pimeloyl-ACP methyl ester carboxylesterase